MISDWDDLCLSDSKLTTEENELLIIPYQPRGKSKEDVLKNDAILRVSQFVNKMEKS